MENNVMLSRWKTCVVFIAVLIVAALPASASRYTRTVETYDMPEVTLVNQKGEKVAFAEYIDHEYPVVVEFIFATCTTICPILSIGFTHMQKQLGEEASTIRLVSISIDPEYDTPPIMTDYLRRYNAQPGWDFFTGSIEDITSVMNAFDAYVSDKMGHRPLIFLRSPVEKKWVRIDGLMSGKELMKEYAQLKK